MGAHSLSFFLLSILLSTYCQLVRHSRSLCTCILVQMIVIDCDGTEVLVLMAGRNTSTDEIVHHHAIVRDGGQRSIVMLKGIVNVMALGVDDETMQLLCCTGRRCCCLFGWCNFYLLCEGKGERQIECMRNSPCRHGFLRIRTHTNDSIFCCNIPPVATEFLRKFLP